MNAPANVEREALAAGTRVGRFVVVQPIAVGGMGAIYRAFDPELDRIVAIKMVKESQGDATRDAVSAERLLREAKGLGKVSHPNIVTVFDAGMHERELFIAMEFVAGVTLREWAKGRRSIDARIAVMADAARGLAAAHAAGLVHRDFKPDNVIVGADGRARVVDFGLVRDTRALEPDDAEPPKPFESPPTSSAEFVVVRTPLTQLGAVVGTPAYMAPEQLLGLEVDSRADQFSFGVTLFEVLFGRPPFRASSWRDLVASVKSGAFVMPARPRVPPRVRALVTRALDPTPARRFDSMDAVVAELEAARAPRRHTIEALAGAVTVVALALVALVHHARATAAVCAVDASDLAGVWDAPTRAAMVSAFEATAVPGARDSADRVSQKLDAFMHDWLAMRAEACRAARVTRQQPEDVYRLRSDCLDRERSEVRSVTSLLASADTQVVKRALDIAYGLPNLSWCADVPTLRASAGLPDDPEKRERVKAIRTKLADARSRELAGEMGEALVRADEAVTMARAADHAATTAEALLFAGTVRGRQGDFGAEIPMLKEAFLRASSSGTDSVVVRIAGVLSFVLGPKLQRADEARAWIERARAALDHMGGNDELALGIEEREASLRIEVEGRPDLAIPIQEKIVAAYKKTYGAAPSTAIALNNLGDAYASLGDPEHARPFLEDAVRIAEEVGGPSYGILGTSEQLLGQVQLEMGDTRRGEANLERALSIFEDNRMPYWSALAVERLAASALARGDGELARTRSQRALALFREAKEPTDLVATVDVTAGLALAGTQPSEALRLCAAALAEEEKEKAIDPDESYGWDALRCEAEAKIEEGRSADAVALLERSLTLKKRSFRGDYARTEFALARALVDAHGDVARAKTLARAARATFAALPFLSFELGRVDAWLAHHGGR